MTGNTMRSFDQIKVKARIVTFVITFLLLGLIGALVAVNYVSGQKLCRSSLQQLIPNIEKRAIAVSCFYAERENDLKALSESRLIGAYFENKALGMSMEYGLAFSLQGIYKSFHRHLNERKIGKARIYERIVFVASTGQTLVDTEQRTGKDRLGTQWKKRIAAHDTGSNIIVDQEGKNISLMVLRPCYFKGDYVGQIVAWISPQTLNNLIETSNEKSKGAVFIAYNHRHIFPTTALQQGHEFIDFPDIRDVETGKPHQFKITRKNGEKVDILAVRVAVKKTPLSIVSFYPVSELFGFLAPWHLPSAMGGLAVILVVGIVIGFRINTQNLVLHARLDESSKREQEIKRKNQQLEKEIHERKTTEKLLKSARDDLENRVKQRTLQLATANEKLEAEITERKETERILRTERGQLLSIFESINQNIYIADPHTHEILYVNDHIREAFKKDAVGGVCYKEFQGMDSPCEFCTNEIILNNNYKPYQWAYHNPIIDRDFMVIDRIIKWTDGRDVRFEIAMDITEKKQAEEKKKELEVKLLQAQKMEAIGTLAGGVAHDLNNILAGLVSYPELLLMDLPVNSPLRKPIKTIKESGKKAAAIVQDLLTMARRGVQIKEVVNLNRIIAEYLKSAEFEKLKAFQPKVEVITSFEKPLRNITGSPVHLSKAVMNLISNASEAMPNGGRITISTEGRHIDGPVGGIAHLDAGEYVILKVSDTGMGISQEDIGRIFEPFYTKKVMGRSGTGLGMAVVWGTVKDHNGYIDVQSDETSGTTCTLYFPTTQEDLTQPMPPLPIEKYKGNRETVLVVDDVEEQRVIASEILSRLDYKVASVASGEEAVDYMKKNSPDLMVLDMVMDPGIDGFETYRRILEFRPKQKAIIASGFSETDRVRDAQKLGAGPCIKKPYTIEKIGLAVRTELGKF